METNTKRKLFDHYLKSARAAGLDEPESLICPLCWERTEYAELSLEHIVPGSVGGKRVVLTCTTCNNTHGSRYDAQLAQYQSTHDGFKGHGTIPAKLRVRGREVTANIEWGDGFKNINIVGEASNPTEVQAMHDDAASGRFDELHLTLNYGYIKNRFQTGLLRCAYLALFKCFGYEYANTEIVQTIRRKICDMEIEKPRLGSLIGVIPDCTLPYNDAYFIVPGNVNGVQFFMVAIRLKKASQTYHFVYMPVPVERSDQFFDTMETFSAENNGIELTIPHELVFT